MRTDATLSQGKEHSSPPPPETASAYLLPSFRYIPKITLNVEGIEDFAKAFLLPTKLHKAHDVLSQEQQNLLLRDPTKQQLFAGARNIEDILVLICGHGQRDERCGILGPILMEEFHEKLQQQDIALATHPPSLDVIDQKLDRTPSRPTARVALISHIGGHKWAGNVIVYIPPHHTWNALAGKGIWYGRVGPEHVEGIVAATILGGQVIKNMFRGGIDKYDGILRL